MRTVKCTKLLDINCKINLKIGFLYGVIPLSFVDIIIALSSKHLDLGPTGTSVNDQQTRSNLLVDSGYNSEAQCQTQGSIDKNEYFYKPGVRIHVCVSCGRECSHENVCVCIK